MSLRSWFRHPIAEFRKWSTRKQLKVASEETKRSLPLREFVYLDAVSLHSLLVSQNATIPNEVSQAISRAEEAELTGTVGTRLGSDVLGGTVSAETAARYQTNNSNNMQSSRKAVIQTLFKELRELPLDFKLAVRDEAPAKLKDVAAVMATSDRQAVEPASGFTRGTIIEVEVTLSVDPVFKLGTMMAEWTAMADDLPWMFGNQGLLDFLRDAQPIMKVLDRFLAGLIPIRATATNHVVVEVDGQEYIVHRAAIEGLELKTLPLHVVGVTEHIGYWKDIRRVLFSNARFTVLCRVARDGLHHKWTPVKRADLFSEVAPDFVDQINAIRSPSAADVVTSPLRNQQLALSRALSAYRDDLTTGDGEWEGDSEAAFQALKAKLVSGPTDAVAQRHAFDRVRELAIQELDVEPLAADADLKARQDARTKSGLELFSSSGIELSPSTVTAPAKKEELNERMLDTEVIAIYW